MRPSKQIKPVSFMEENAYSLADVLDESGEPLILTQDGEAKFVLQSVKAYEETQETIALLKLLLLSEASIAEGGTRSAREAVEELRRKYHAA